MPISIEYSIAIVSELIIRPTFGMYYKANSLSQPIIHLYPSYSGELTCASTGRNDPSCKIKPTSGKYIVQAYIIASASSEYTLTAELKDDLGDYLALYELQQLPSSLQS